ncbi:Firmicu-CTERM sorting domain-containing protein [Lacticaseibacillus hulanensis]|uniref:Firmicu-CTERM sorting domain-containing protein n=1 Tax=Lacticaseibacillus hulanensis TaxID=2493111 RepID=UPI000FDC9DD7|nr:Firmicu-CTERM sorting domain-containing protein [Lacticaseibacillus hulanensis]
MKLHRLFTAGAVLIGMAGAIVSATAATVHAGTFSSSTQNAAAVTPITIDGDFSDWSGVSGANLNWWNGAPADNTTQVKLRATTSTLYVYAQVHTGQNNNAVPQALWSFMVGGQTLAVQLGQSATQSGSVPVILNDHSAQVGTAQVTRSTADGSTYKQDYSTVEFSVDLASAKLSPISVGSTVTMDGSGTGFGNTQTPVASVTTGVATSGMTTGSAATTEPVDANGVVEKTDADTTQGHQNNNNDDANINIDGQYNDWANIPLTSVNNGGKMGMTSDGQYAYVYVRTGAYQTVPQQSYNFTVGGQTYFIKANDDGNLAEGETENVAVTAGKDNSSFPNTVGTAAISKVANPGAYTGWHEEMEFTIDLKKLGLSDMAGQDLNIFNYSLGGNTVTTAGGSTGPVVLSGIGVLLAGVGYMKVKKIGLGTRTTVRVHGK